VLWGDDPLNAPKCPKSWVDDLATEKRGGIQQLEKLLPALCEADVKRNEQEAATALNPGSHT
jgi:hypothetical protein